MTWSIVFMCWTFEHMMNTSNHELKSWTPVLISSTYEIKSLKKFNKKQSLKNKKLIKLTKILNKKKVREK